MPIRIYALAKDLQIDSKELVDICTKAGIPGKGSALASLNDDEEIRGEGLSGELRRNDVGAATPAEPVRTGSGLKIGPQQRWLAQRMGGGSKSTATPAAPITRDDYIGPSGFGGKIKVIGTRRSSGRSSPPTTTEVPGEVCGRSRAEAPPAAAEPPETAASGDSSGGDSASRTVPGRSRTGTPSLRPLEHADAGSIKIIGGPIASGRTPANGARNDAPPSSMWPRADARGQTADCRGEGRTEDSETRDPPAQRSAHAPQRAAASTAGTSHRKETEEGQRTETPRTHVAPFDDEAPRQQPPTRRPSRQAAAA